MLLRAAIACLLAALSLGPPAAAREIRIVGSSTVFPFSTTVAEQFGANSNFPTPIVEQNGTGAGLKLFCSGVGQGFPDIANASRRMKGSEWDLCRANQVTDIVEVPIGFDGIVLANAKRSEPFDLSLRELFLGLAREVPVNGRLVPNPYKRWSDVSADLPDVPIQVFGPPPSSGTRDAFLELAMAPGARSFPELAEIEEDDPALFTEIAHAVREDGHWINAGENDGAIVLRLTRNPDALGVFGFAFLLQNEDRLRGALIDGVRPSFQEIVSGRYEISRSIFFYVKKAHLSIVSGLQEFIAEFTSEKSWGEDGYLIDKGLIPLPAAERKAAAEASRGMIPMAERPPS